MTTPQGTLRVLMLTRYAQSGASSRVRMYQYLPHLESAGMEVAVEPLLDDDYVARLYRSGGRRLTALASNYWGRLRAVLAAARFDLVWLEKECWPWAPAVLDPGLLAKRVPYVVDYDDAVFHNYDLSRSALLRALFGAKIDTVMQRSALVTAGNSYLADRARTAGAARIEIVPSVVDLARYATPAGRRREEGLVVGWIGSPATQHLVEPLVPALAEVLDSPADRFVTIGARFGSPLLANHEVVQWSEAREAADVARFDIGIMPLPDHPFERGKCGFKLIQYMAAGVPTIASPVGVNAQIVTQGVTGFLADNEEEWVRALRTLKGSPQLRADMGMAGRKAVEERYSLKVTGPRVASLLRSVVGR